MITAFGGTRAPSTSWIGASAGPATIAESPIVTPLPTVARNRIASSPIVRSSPTLSGPWKTMLSAVWSLSPMVIDVPLREWKVTRSSICARAPMTIGLPSSARIEVRRPTIASGPSRTSPTMRANGSRDSPAPMVGRSPRLKLVRGEREMPVTAVCPASCVQLGVVLGELLVDLEDLALEVRVRLLLAGQRVGRGLRQHTLADPDDPIARDAYVTDHRAVADERAVLDHGVEDPGVEPDEHEVPDPRVDDLRLMGEARPPARLRRAVRARASNGGAIAQRQHEDVVLNVRLRPQADAPAGIGAEHRVAGHEHLTANLHAAEALYERAHE